LSACGATLVVYRFPRRWLYLRGQLAVATILGLFALMIYLRKALLAISMIVLFEFACGMSVAGLHWIYIPEILSDTQFGFVASFHYFNGVIVSLISEPMFKYLRPEGTFAFFSICSFFGFIFMYFNVKETNGLSDRQRKELYVPKQFIGTRLESDVDGADLDASEIELESVDVDIAARPKLT